MLAGWKDPAFNVLGHRAPANRVARHDGVSLAYDGRGNVVSRQTAAGRWDYAWNALNQMTASKYTPAGQSGGVYGADTPGPARKNQ